MHQFHLQIDGPAQADCNLILAHGAGQDMRSELMDFMAEGFAAGGLRVVRFRFPYMDQIAGDGRRRPPDREAVLLARFEAVIDEQLASGLRPEGLLIGGKSLGGRMASLVAGRRSVAGLVCLGYPFHPPGRPERLRTAHLATLTRPTLICQGTRDPFGTPDEVAGYRLSPVIRLAWIEDGEHSFKPGRRSGRTWEQNLAAVVEAVVAFARVGSRSGGSDGA